MFTRTIAASVVLSAALSALMTFRATAQEYAEVAEDNGPTLAGRLQTREELLFRAPASVSAGHRTPGPQALVAISRDGSHAAVADRRGTGMAITVDGQPLRKRFHEVHLIHLSPDGSRCAWIASDEDQGLFTTSVLAVNQAEVAHDLYMGLGGGSTFAFSPDSRHYVCNTHKINTASHLITQALIVDGVTHADGPGGFAGFSPDGSHHAYMTVSGTAATIVFDGATHGLQRGPYDQFAPPLISPDWSRMAIPYTAAGQDRHPHPIGIVIEADGRRTMIGDVRQSFSACGNVDWSPACNHMAFPVSDASGTRMVVDGNPGKAYRQIEQVTGTHGFSPDSEHYAYVADGLVVLDGRELNVPGMGPGKLWKLVFSRDSKRIACIGEWNHSPMIVLDGTIVEKSVDRVAASTSFVFCADSTHYQFSTSDTLFIEGEEANEKGTIVAFSQRFSADGRHDAFLVRSGSGHAVVVDGVKGESFPSIDKDSLRFSPDGQHVAYVARARSGSVVVRDKVKGKVYRSIIVDSLAFDPASNHLAYLAESASTSRPDLAEPWVLVADGRESQRYSLFLPLGATTSLTSHSSPASFEARTHHEAARWVGFDGPDSVHAVALRSGDIVRILCKTPGH
jgi:hypothetical protein